MLFRFWVALLRFGFRLLYYELAWTYDVVSWVVSLGAWRDWQRASLPFVYGKHVLEVGHGPGHMLLALQTAGYKGVGIDISPHMGRLAQRRTKAPLSRANVMALPFKTAVFDTVLSTFPTPYIVEPATLTAIYRVLQSNGRLIVVPEARLTGHGLRHRLIDWLYHITGQRVQDGDNIWYPFQERLTATGFVVTIEKVTLPSSEVTVIVAEKKQI